MAPVETEIVLRHGSTVHVRPATIEDVPRLRAFLAFAVADDRHGHGIATVLIGHLAHAASAAGIDTFTATVLSENRRMLGVFHDAGFPVVSRREEDEIALEFPTSLSRDARRRFEERQRAAADLGGPVALKAVAPGLGRKSDAGGVRLGLAAAPFPSLNV
jgi:GNAT superfamily N-acetyltransferase